MPPNTVNTGFPFGFLNNNQDAVDLDPTEASAIDSVDADDMALGKMRTSDYIQPGSGPKDWTGVSTPVLLGGRAFRLNSGRLQFEKNKGMGDWEYVNNDPDNLGVANPNAFPPKGTQPSVVPTKTVSITPSSGSVDIPLIQWQEDPLAAYNGPDVRSYIVEIDDDTPAAVTFRWKFGTDTTWRQSAVPLDGGNFQTLDNNIQVRMPTEAEQSGGASGAYVIGDTASTTVTKNSLPDGDYAYVVVNVKNTGLDPDVEVEGLPSDVLAYTVANLDASGNPISGGPLSAEITMPAMPNNTDEMWLFRRGPDEEDFIRVFVDTVGSSVFIDTVQASTIVPLVLLQSENDESFYDLNLAIGNPSQQFVKLFEKDNRLWLVPSDREDLVLYSRLNDWWGWQRINSFSFTGDITDIAKVRDPTVVGGQFTTVFATESGIFHITGNGTENSPYVRVEAVSDIFVEANSLIDMNGVLMLMSRSTDGGYDTGRYGQKIYEYNLQSLIEVSARVKNSTIITSTEAVEYAEMRGSDKYLIKKENVSDLLLYHRDARGWVKLTQTGEDNGWFWQSKRYAPLVGQRILMGAREIKLDFIGDLTLTFRLYGPDDSVAPEIKTITFVHAVRQEVIQRLPLLEGRKWRVELQANDNTTTLYDYYYVN